MEKIKGRIWKFGDNIDTDAIVPGTYLDAPLQEIVKHVFESIHPKFLTDVRQGDIIIAGKNFGCGSSRENAPAALKEMGISCIVAESFARIFFRNAIALGLPVLNCSGIHTQFKEGDYARIDLKNATIENIENGTTLVSHPMHAEIIKIIEQGGILNTLKQLATITDKSSK